MSHDAEFAAHRARREAERAAQVKVTWRKVSDLTGGGWSGLGPDGALVWVEGPDGPLNFYRWGPVVDGRRELKGGCPTLARAKAAAAELFTPDNDAPTSAEGGTVPTTRKTPAKVKPKAAEPVEHDWNIKGRAPRGTIRTCALTGARQIRQAEKGGRASWVDLPAGEAK